MGLGLKPLGPFKNVPLRTQTLTPCGEANRAILSSPGWDSGQPLTLQLHKDMMYSKSLNLGSSHISSHRLAAVLLGLQQTPNPSLHGVGGTGSVLLPAMNIRFQRHQLSMLFIPVFLKGPTLTGLSKIPPTAKWQIALVHFLLRGLKRQSFSCCQDYRAVQTIAKDTGKDKLSAAKHMLYLQGSGWTKDCECDFADTLPIASNITAVESQI